MLMLKTIGRNGWQKGTDRYSSTSTYEFNPFHERACILKNSHIKTIFPIQTEGNRINAYQPSHNNTVYMFINMVLYSKC